ncbi:MAG: ABC transporter ATP-binding protein [Nocardioidaceae bacterium]
MHANTGTESGEARRPLLEVNDLTVEFRTEAGIAQAVNGVSFTLAEGEILGLVGESGSGKSVTAMSLLGLVPQPPARLRKGQALFDGRDLLTLERRELRRVRGGQVGVVFQDPMTALNPVQKVGKQIGEVLRLHNRELSPRELTSRAVDLLGLVGVPQPDVRVRQHPHELSGGLRQRVMIAIAIANNPRLLIADEPTTALDVTIQAQVLMMLRKAQRETGAATLLITHDLGVVAQMAERVIVMYAGRIVEQGPVREMFARPRHPYTVGLLDSLPRLDHDDEQLQPIRGNPPSLLNPPDGCAFAARCGLRQGRERCLTERPELVEVGDGRLSACHFHDELVDPDGGRPVAVPTEQRAADRETVEAVDE